MISGFNTDVEHRGQVFHVQTEEKGPDNPVVVTLVYCGGQIVASLELPYIGATDLPTDLPEDEIRKRMREQHQVLIRDVRNGKFDPVSMPYGHEFLTDRSLDEVVLAYLGDSIDRIAEGAEAGAGEPGPRAVHVARVLHRLERFLDAAERAGAPVDDGASAAAGLTASTPVESEPLPASPVEPELALGARPELDVVPDESAEPPANDRTEPHRPRRRRHVLVPAVLALAGASVVVWLGWPEPAPRPRDAAPPPGIASREAVESSPPADPVESASASVPQPVDAGPEAEPVTLLPAEPVRAEGPSRPRGDVQEPPVPPSRPTRTTPPQRKPSPAVPADGSRPAEAQAGVTPPRPEPDVAPPAGVALPPPVRVGQLVDIDAVDVLPQPQRRDLPRYTSRARRTKQQGVIELSLLIDERGEVADVQVTRDDAGADLAREALSVAREWRFSPARKDLRPVKVRQAVSIEFSILPDRSTSVRIRE